MYKVIIFVSVFLYSTIAVGSDLCERDPDNFLCVPDSEKILLNRDLINESTNKNRQRIFSLERSVDSLSGGVAASIAMGSHQFDLSSSNLQGSVAVSSFEDSNGASFSIGGQVSDWSFLNVSGAKGSHGVSAVSASFTWGF